MPTDNFRPCLSKTYLLFHEELIDVISDLHSDIDSKSGEDDEEEKHFFSISS